MYNMSTLDGITRVFLTAIWAGVFGAIGGYVGLIGILSIYFFVTGLGGYCPIYKMLGISTLEDPEANMHSIHGHKEEINLKSSEYKSAA